MSTAVFKSEIPDVDDGSRLSGRDEVHYVFYLRGGDGRLVADYDQPLHYVLQLSHVSGPRISFKGDHRLRSEKFGLLIFLIEFT